jgi:hypothetical protein
MVYGRSLQDAPLAPSWTPVSSWTVPALDAMGATTTDGGPSSQQPLLQPPPITCFSVSPDGRVATGDAAGGVTLYLASCGSNRAVTHVVATSAALREQERMVTSKRVIRYPNAVTACQWWRRNSKRTKQQKQQQQQQHSQQKGDLILVWTVDELEALVMNDSHSEAVTVWKIPLNPVWSKTAGPLSPSSLDYSYSYSSNLNMNSNENAVLWTCQGRLPKEETDSAVSLYRLEWKDDDDVVAVVTDTAVVTDADMDTASADGGSPAPMSMVQVQRSVVVPTATTTTTMMDANADTALEPNGYTTETWTCLTAIWDAWQEKRDNKDDDGNNDNDTSNSSQPPKRRIILVGQSRSRPDHWELMRLHDGESAQQKQHQVQHQTVIEGCGRSSAASVSVTLQQDCQSGAGYTFLSSHKGIRLYDTENLALLQTYGETVQLHGKTVTWQSALWIPAPGGKAKSVAKAAAVNHNGKDKEKDTLSSQGEQQQQQQVVRTSTAGTNKKQSWLERGDELAYRNGWSALDEHWLIGVPHPSKGPMELNSTLYVWKPGQAQAVTTLQAPAGGLLGVCGVTDCTGWRFLSATADPNGMWECRATLKSDFAGVMYPVGYQVISDNLEYIEDEDELDQVVVVFDEEEEETDDDDDVSVSADEGLDEDLAEALRLSILEQKQKKKEAEEGDQETIVSVLLDDEEDLEDLEPVACWPDPSLQEQLLFDSEGGGKSAVKDSPHKKAGFMSEVLSSLPAFKRVQRELLWRREQEMERMSPVPTEEGGVNSASSLLPPRPKSKRTRTANVEALLQVSIDPVLRLKMSRLHKQWADGSKSALRRTDLGVAVPDEAAVEWDGIPAGETTEPVNSFLPKTTTVSGEDVTVSLPETEGQEPKEVSNEKEIMVTGDESEILFKGDDSLALLPKDANSTASLAQPVGGTEGAYEKETSEPMSKPSAIQIVTSASAEEQELALELLLLSPGKSSPKETDVSSAPSMPFAMPIAEADNQNDSEPEASNGGPVPSKDVVRVEEERGVVVSPSEPIPAQGSATGCHPEKDVTAQERSRALLCAACRGRMVIHSCGQREKPVDYEAIARAEKEEKEKEEAEKQRIRTEKRRAAEAKRREARRNKKEEGERKMQETQERMRRLEAEQFEKAHIREHEEESIDRARHTGQNQSGEWSQRGFRPPMTPIETHSAQAMHAFSELVSGQTQVAHGFEQERPYYYQDEARSTAFTETEAPRTSQTPQDGYYNYSETPVPVSTSTVQTWDAQQYPSSSFVQDGYYDRSQSAPPNYGQGFDDAPQLSSTVGPHDTSVYRPESAPPFSASSAHGLHDGNHQYSELAPPAPASSFQGRFASSTETTAPGPSSCAPFYVDASELKPSMTLSTTDALAALAGLANSMPVATSHGFGAPTNVERTDEAWNGQSHDTGPNEMRGSYSGYDSSYGHATGNGFEQGYPEGSYYNEKGWSSHHGSSYGSAPLSSLVAPQAAAVAFSNGTEGYTYDAHATEGQGPPQPPM